MRRPRKITMNAERIKAEIATIRSIEIWCTERHPDVALGQFESYGAKTATTLGLRELWRINGPHVRREMMDDPTIAMPPGIKDATELPDQVWMLLGGTQRYVFTCPATECDQKLELNALIAEPKRRETFARLTRTADALTAAGMSRRSLAEITYILTH